MLIPTTKLTPPCADNAPITKIIFWTSIGMTLVARSPEASSAMVIGDQSQITLRHQVWRLFTSLIPSESLAEGIVSWILLYSFRLFERELGSSKFAVFVTLSTVVAMLTRLALVYMSAAIPSSLMQGLASGPYHLVFGLLPLYFRLVPALHREYFNMFGIKFSDKSLTYAMSVQLLFSGGLRSIFPALAGLLFGILYSIDVLRINRLRVPKGVRTAFRTWVLPLVQSEPPISARPPPTAATSGTVAGARGRGGGAAGVGGGGGAPVPLGPEPSPEAVQRLVDMGFDEAAARRALRETFGNEEAAANRLLS